MYSNNQELLTHKKEILENIFLSANKQSEIAKSICLELFPQLQPYYPKPLGVPSGNPVIWRKERRVCSEDVFDTYFVLNVPMGEISKGELQQFVEIANQSDQLISLFRQYKEQGRIARLHEWLNDVLDELSEDGILEFCHALIEFGDELADIRKSIFDSGTDIRMPWLISQALKRIKSPSSRFNWFLKEVNSSSSLFTVTQQVSWNVPSKEDLIPDPIFDKQQLEKLTQACVKKIEDDSQNGRLL